MSDDEKRRIYDKYGEEGLKGNHQQYHNPFDIFAQFGGGGGGQRGERKGHGITIPFEVTLDELFLGNTVEIEINKQVICPNCRGSGAKSHKHVKDCSTCGGSGVQIVRQQFAPGIYQQMQTTCQSCGGKGKIISEHCPICAGQKVKRGSHQITLYIERGMSEGSRIEFEGESDQYPDMQAGDIVFVLKQRPHAIFTRKGKLDLMIKHTVTLKEALLGFSTEIKHMDGSSITLSREAVTQSGKSFL